MEFQKKTAHTGGVQNEKQKQKVYKMNKNMLKNKLNEMLMAGNWEGVKTLVDAMFMFGLVPWYNEDGFVEEVTRIK